MIFKTFNLFIFVSAVYSLSCTSPSSQLAKQKNFVQPEAASPSKSNTDEIDLAFYNSTDYYIVTKIIDGDTFWVISNTSSQFKVRLIGVDTPETRRSRNKEIGFYGKEATKYLESIIIDKKIRLEFDIDTIDQYHRVLAYVYLEDGTFLNAKLVIEGYASVMTVPPNVKYQSLFLNLQRIARENNMGLWGKDF